MDNFCLLKCFYSDKIPRYTRTLFLSRGFLLDELRNIDSSLNIEEHILECTLYTLEDEFINDMHIYAYGDMGLYRYYTPKAAAASGLCEQGDISKVMVFELNSYMYPEVEFPREVTLEVNRRGGYVTRLHLHPNTDGISLNGKVYFVDRSWVNDAWGGRATVSVKTEHSRCGYLIGSMKVDDLCDEDTFRNYCWDTFKSPDTNICEIRLPSGDTTFGIGFRCEEGVGLDVLYWDTLREGSAPLVRTMTWKFPKEQWDARLVSMQLYGDFAVQDIHGTNFDVIAYVQRVSSCKFCDSPIIRDGYTVQYNVVKHPVRCDWQRVYSVRGQSSLLNRAVDCGLVRLNGLVNTNILACEFVPSRIDRLTLFSIEELDALADEMEQVNRKADEMITACVRNGKLRLAGVAV